MNGLVGWRVLQIRSEPLTTTSKKQILFNSMSAVLGFFFKRYFSIVTTAYFVIWRKQDAHQLVGRAKRRATQIWPKSRLKVAGDVISGVAVDDVGMDVRATFDESGLNTGRIIWLFGRPDPFYASLLCSN